MYPEPSGRQPTTVIIQELGHRTRVQNAHVRYPLEEQIHRSFSVGGRWRGHTGQGLPNRTPPPDFDVFAGHPGKPLDELINLGGTYVHEPPIIPSEWEYYHRSGARSPS